jgi:molybdopterin converting factor small subunit
MKVTVLFFAYFRQVFETDRRVMDISDGTRAGDLWRQISGSARSFPADFPVLLAVNESFVPAPHRLRDGDTVAFMPPVAGG